MKRKTLGFSIIELIVVIMTIGILAGLVIGANINRERVKKAKTESDLTVILNSIKMAHLNEEKKTLTMITGRNFSGYACRPDGGNPGNVEPKNLPKTHACWTQYHDVLKKVGASAGDKLYEQLKDGDPNGNPYGFDENEGEYVDNPCRQNYIFIFDANGTADWKIWRRVPFTLRECKNPTP
jgi:type II secretory pathway pseudopilin PulG